MTDYEIVKAFVDRVCQQAERNMAKTNRLEGAHYAAMVAELGRMEGDAIANPTHCICNRPARWVGVIATTCAKCGLPLR